jgi:gluconate 2-dehydrogenase gamma chain
MAADEQSEGGRTDAADSDGFSRRSFLRVMGAALGGTVLTLEWSEIAKAAHDAHRTAQAPGAGGPFFFTPAELADVAAIAEQIIPSDGTPGAREASVGHFIDRALASFLSRLAPTFRTQFAEFRAQCHLRHPAVASFAALSSEQQIEFLKTVDRTPFFESMRLLTVLGMFTSPQYGGNRDGLGWKLLGFEDQHIFMPPFGYYDRDYPGFSLQEVATA